MHARTMHTAMEGNGPWRAEGASHPQYYPRECKSVVFPQNVLSTRTAPDPPYHAVKCRSPLNSRPGKDGRHPCVDCQNPAGMYGHHHASRLRTQSCLADPKKS
eukprot:350631-Chlamydomonas_euryale.AAC.14